MKANDRSAEHALAVFHRHGRKDDAVGNCVRLGDAIRQLEPSWVEAVAIVQGVSALLERGEMAPAIGDVVLAATGEISIPPGGIADEDVAIQAMARMLARTLGQNGRPLEVWEAVERAQVAPMTFGSARGFGASLTCVPSHMGRPTVAAYVRNARRAPAPPPHRTAATSVSWLRRFRLGATPAPGTRVRKVADK